MHAGGVTLFEVWAPKPTVVRLDVDGTRHSMTRADDGWWRASVPAAEDSRYGFVLDDDATVLPDPRSPRQPEGVHAPSQLHTLDVSAWTDHAWTGRPLAGGIVYELHVGTFTPAGTFDAAIERLDHLVDLGVTFVQLMPVNGFNGTHNWGYDGVLWYTVHEPYGGPDGLQRFVDACHRRGLAVLLDVVYNHLGPSGNYLPRFGPYFAEGEKPGVSRSTSPAPDPTRSATTSSTTRCAGCATSTSTAYASTPFTPSSTPPPYICSRNSPSAAEALSAHVRRPLTLIAESDLNDPRLITPRAAGGYGLTAQWDDDIHHAIHSAVSGERQGYYGDFGSMSCLAYTLGHGYFHDSTYSSFRHRRHGRPLDISHIPASSLFAYTYTHDQVGNRAVGDRPSAYLTPGQLAVKAALVLLSPYSIMLFMGEEWGATTPFQFFTSHPEPELGQATAEGRKRGIRRARLGFRRRAEPAGPADVRTLQVGLDRTRRATAGSDPRVLPRSHRTAGGAPGDHRPMADRPSRRLRRGTALDRVAPRRPSRRVQPCRRTGDRPGRGHAGAVVGAGHFGRHRERDAGARALVRRVGAG